jgi:hypothetical protein
MTAAKAILGSVASSVAALAGIGGLAAFASSTLEAVDAAGKLASRVGMTTEQLTALQYAADLSDVSAESLGGALEKLSRYMATAGGGEAEKSLSKLGLSLKQLQGMDTMSAFMAISDGLSRISDAGERAALIAQIFGKGASEMGNLLNAGSAEIRNAMMEAQAFGQTFTDSQAAMANSINDNLTRVSKAFNGALAQALLTVTPLLESFLNAVTLTLSATNGWIPTVIKIAGGLAAAALAVKAVNLAILAYTTVQKAATTAGAIFQAVVGGPAAWAKLAAGVVAATVAVVAIDYAFESTAQTVAKATDQNNANVASLDAQTAATAGLTAAQKQLQMQSFGTGPLDITASDADKPWTDTAKAFEAHVDEWKKKLQEVTDFAAMPISPMEKYLKMVNDVNGAYEAGLIPLEKRNQLLNDIDRKIVFEQQQAQQQKMAQARESAIRKGQSVRDSVMTPVDRMRKSIQELKQLYSMGAIDPTTFQRAVQAEWDKAKTTEKVARREDVTKFAGAQKAGSAEAFSTILNAWAQQNKKTAGEREVITNLRELIRVVKEQGVETVVSIS